MLENKLTPTDVESMGYTQFVALIKEANRPSGGKKTIRTIVQNSFLNKDSSVLEIGSTTGFTSLEIKRLIDCNVCGIDVCMDSIRVAKEEAAKDNKSSKTNFLKASALFVPFKDESFDLVVCGNATSFLNEKEKAIHEYNRVLKSWGFLSVTPVYYIKQPPSHVVQAVSDTVGCEIKVRDKKFWLDILTKDFELYFTKDNSYEYLDKKTLKDYASYMTNKPHLAGLSYKTRRAVQKRVFDSMSLFNENLKYANYSIMLLRKRIEPEEFELFKTYEIKE